MPLNDALSGNMSELELAASEYGIDCVTSVEDCDFATEML